MKKAFITGITGQDGSFLAEYLLGLGYDVSGLIRRNSFSDFGNVDHLKGCVRFFYGDMTDESSLLYALQEAKPDEVYNLAAQSFVKVSWTQPVFTSEVNGLGVLRLLNAMRAAAPSAKFYQASTSELFGQVQEIPQTEMTPFYPRSPYGVSKLFGHWIMKNYRESYGMFCCGGILFNHESERRKIEFVTRKITFSAAAIANGRMDCLYLGNLDARRDWGYAPDYVRAMWLMLQQDEPSDYIVASGETHSVREFAQCAFLRAGIPLAWEGEGTGERAVDTRTGNTVIRVSEEFFRPAEVMLLQGDPSRAERLLHWKRTVSFEGLVERMTDFDLAAY